MGFSVFLHGFFIVFFTLPEHPLVISAAKCPFILQKEINGGNYWRGYRRGCGRGYRQGYRQGYGRGLWAALQAAVLKPGLGPKGAVQRTNRNQLHVVLQGFTAPSVHGVLWGCVRGCVRYAD